MASYGDLGEFLPSATPYSSPGQDIAAAKTEAAKRAAYLAEMDQFYASLAETQREFDLTYQYKYDVLELDQQQLAWQIAYGTRSLDLQEEQLAINKQVQLGELEIAKEQLALQKQSLAATTSYNSQKLALESRALSAQVANNKALAELAATKLENQYDLSSQALSLSGNSTSRNTSNAATSYASSYGTTTDLSSRSTGVYTGGDYDLWLTGTSFPDLSDYTTSNSSVMYDVAYSGSGRDYSSLYGDNSYSSWSSYNDSSTSNYYDSYAYLYGE